jgi:hypothetical protein
MTGAALTQPTVASASPECPFLAWAHLALCFDQHCLLKALAAVR